MDAAVEVEWLKFRHARTVIATTLVTVIVLPAMAGSFYAVRDADSNSPVAAKAKAMVIGEGWLGYTSLINHIQAAAVLLAVGILVVWTFGREYSDRTLPSLYALPVSRGRIAWAKFLVLGAWSFTLCLLLTLTTWLGGMAIGLGGLDALVLEALSRVFALGIMTALLALPVALAATLGRGYIPGFATLILLIASAQLAVFAPGGSWYPYASPGLWAMSIESSLRIHVTWYHLLMVPLTAAVGAWVTARQWRRAEVH